MGFVLVFSIAKFDLPSLIICISLIYPQFHRSVWRRYRRDAALFSLACPSAGLGVAWTVYQRSVLGKRWLMAEWMFNPLCQWGCQCLCTWRGEGPDRLVWWWVHKHKERSAIYWAVESGGKREGKKDKSQDWDCRVEQELRENIIERERT